MDVSKLKVAEIKKELKDRGLNTVGNKQELLTRLQEALDAEEIGQVDEDEHLNGAEEAVVDEVDDPKEEETTAIKEEKQTKKIVLKRQSEFPEEPVVSASTKQEITGPKAGDTVSAVIGAKSLTPEERLALRAKRFGTTLTTPAATPAAVAPKTAAPAKTSAAEPVAKKAKVELSDEQKERLRKRAERFGTSVSPLVEVVEAEEKRRQRQERFSTASSTDSVTPDDAPTTISVAPVVEPAAIKVLSLEERKKLRAERFNK